MRALGLMSGTSLDGVDAAIIETDGVESIEFGPSLTIEYSQSDKQKLIEATEIALELGIQAKNSKEVLEAELVLHRTHAFAVRKLMSDIIGQVDVVGFHGQTVLHRPNEGISWQLGDGAVLSREIGINVVSSFRQADIESGGQGAPLAPVYHRAAIRKALGARQAVAFVNIGGVSNLTYVGVDGEVVAFDAGPGNGLIDQLAVRAGFGSYDPSGRFAAQGQVNQGVLQKMLSHAFFDKPGPKSLDRYDFSLAPVEGLSVFDALATLTAFTASAIALSEKHLPAKPEIWVVAGGGRHNNTLMAELRGRINGQCLTAEDVGLRGDAVEAELMAYLAVRTLRKLPLTFPQTTGVPVELCGGVIHAFPANRERAL